MVPIPEGWLTIEQMAEKINSIHPKTISGSSIRVYVRNAAKQHPEYITKIGKTWYINPKWPQLGMWEEKARKEAKTQKLDKYNLIRLADKIEEIEVHVIALQAIIDRQQENIDMLKTKLERDKRINVIDKKRMSLDEAETLMTTFRAWQGSQRSLAKHLGMAESTLRGRIQKARQMLTIEQ